MIIPGTLSVQRYLHKMFVHSKNCITAIDMSFYSRKPPIIGYDEVSLLIVLEYIEIGYSGSSFLLMD